MYHAIAICFDCCCRFFAVMMQSAQCRCKTVMATWNCTYKGNPQKTRRKEKKKKKKTVCARPLKCRELLYYTELWKYFCDILSLNYSFHFDSIYVYFLPSLWKFHNTFSKISPQCVCRLKCALETLSFTTHANTNIQYKLFRFSLISVSFWKIIILFLSFTALWKWITYQMNEKHRQR